MKITHATADDLPALRTLVEQGSSQFAGAPRLFGGEGIEAMPLVAAAISRDEALVCRNGGDEIVGLVTMGIVEDRHVGHIGNMVVAPEARGNGVGRLLAEAAIALMRERGAQESMLIVWNGRSLPEFYSKFGYRPIGVVMAMEL